MVGFASPVAAVRPGSAACPQEPAPLPPWSLRCAAPPYDALTDLPGEALPTLRRGSVVVVSAETAALGALADVAAAAQAIRARTPNPLVLCLGPALTPELLHLAAHAHSLGFSGVIPGAAPLGFALRTALTCPWALPERWVGWLRERSFAPVALEPVLLDLVRLAPHAADLPTLLRRLKIPERTLSERLRRAALPKLERWYTATRLLHAELALQRQPHLPLRAASAELRYADSYSFSNAFYRLFGITPSASRRLLGLEWRLAAWFARSRRP